ncbi:MAG TPA: hypothetical protein VHT34_07270, partial [Clostridia bacterium]|nr:hypothetical protein [Clostridia bacterium]
MQEKKIIKYTREGIQEENLATGETQMLTLSHYGRELKYSTDDEPVCYTEESQNIHRHPTAYRQGSRRASYSIAKSTYSEWDSNSERSDQDGGANQTYLSEEAKSRSNGSRNASAKSNTRETQESSGQSQNSSKEDVSGKLRTHMSNFRSMLLNSSESSSKDLKDNDSLGPSTFGSYSQTAIKALRGSTKRTGKLFSAAKSITDPAISKNIQESDNLSLSVVGSSPKIKSAVQSGIRWTKRAVKLIQMTK